MKKALKLMVASTCLLTVLNSLPIANTFSSSVAYAQSDDTSYPEYFDSNFTTVNMTSAELDDKMPANFDSLLLDDQFDILVDLINNQLELKNIETEDIKFYSFNGDSVTTQVKNHDGTDLDIDLISDTNPIAKLHLSDSDIDTPIYLLFDKEFMYEITIFGSDDSAQIYVDKYEKDFLDIVNSNLDENFITAENL